MKDVKKYILDLHRRVLFSEDCLFNILTSVDIENTDEFNDLHFLHDTLYFLCKRCEQILKDYFNEN